MDTYNQQHFPLDMEESLFDLFDRTPRPGARALNGTLTDLADGSAVTLKSLWKQGPLVVEFGSHS